MISKIQTIRILPSDKKTFVNEKSFKAFIETTMVERGGLYYFPGQMMKCPTPTFVLFQYGGMIRATGILLETVKTDITDERGVNYSGYYRFDIESLNYLSKPIDAKTMRAIYPDFVCFSQSKQEIPIKYLEPIYGHLFGLTVKSIESDLEYSKLQGRDRDVFVKARVNQSVFRQQLINRYGKCCLCGMSNESLLIASHIKPWSVSNPYEKLDIDNGFLMCPNHDKLFDSGLISFDEDGRILISSKLSESDRFLMNIDESLVIKLTENNKKYLKYHRNNIFKKN